MAAHIEGNLAGSGYGASAAGHASQGGGFEPVTTAAPPPASFGHVRRRRGHVRGVGGAGPRLSRMDGTWRIMWKHGGYIISRASWASMACIEWNHPDFRCHPRTGFQPAGDAEGWMTATAGYLHESRHRGREPIGRCSIRPHAKPAWTGRGMPCVSARAERRNRHAVGVQVATADGLQSGSVRLLFFGKGVRRCRTTAGRRPHGSRIWRESRVRRTGGSMPMEP